MLSTKQRLKNTNSFWGMLFFLRTPSQVMEVWHPLHTVPINTEWLDVCFLLPDVHNKLLGWVVFRGRLLSVHYIHFVPVHRLRQGETVAWDSDKFKILTKTPANCSAQLLSTHPWTRSGHVAFLGLTTCSTYLTWHSSGSSTSKRAKWFDSKCQWDVTFSNSMTGPEVGGVLYSLLNLLVVIIDQVFLNPSLVVPLSFSDGSLQVGMCHAVEQWCQTQIHTWPKLKTWTKSQANLDISCKTSTFEEVSNTQDKMLLSFVQAHARVLRWILYYAGGMVSMKFMKFWDASSVLFLWFLGCFGHSHYTPSSKAASFRVISPELASHAQLITKAVLLLRDRCPEGLCMAGASYSLSQP